MGCVNIYKIKIKYFGERKRDMSDFEVAIHMKDMVLDFSVAGHFRVRIRTMDNLVHRLP